MHDTSLAYMSLRSLLRYGAGPLHWTGAKTIIVDSRRTGAERHVQVHQNSALCSLVTRQMSSLRRRSHEIVPTTPYMSAYWRLPAVNVMVCFPLAVQRNPCPSSAVLTRPHLCEHPDFMRNSSQAQKPLSTEHRLLLTHRRARNPR